VLPPEVQATIAQLEAKAQKAKEKREREVEIRAREFTEFEQEIKAHEEIMEAWEKRKAEFQAGRAARSAKIGELNDKMADIAENIRQMRQTFAESDDDDEDDDIDIDVDAGADAAASDEDMADAAEGVIVISSAAGQAAEEGEIDDALPIRTIAAQ
jgi:chromosome segregation ATPase